MISKNNVYKLAKQKGKEVIEERGCLIIRKDYYYEAYSCDSDCDFNLVFKFNGDTCVDIYIEDD